MRTMSPGQHQGTWRITLLAALAVFAQESTWNFYESQVPPMLREHISSAAVVGMLMGMDNLLGIFIQPWMGNRSDHTRTAWGRRMPYLVVGMPVAAGLFILLPHAAASLPLLILVMFSYAVVANAFKPIAEALVPDFIAPERRSRANATVKIATSFTTIAAAVISLLLVDDHPKIAFAIPAVIMLISVAVLAATVRDSHSPAYQAAVAESESRSEDATKRRRVRDTLKEIVRDSDRSRLLLLAAILLFGSAWSASRSLITPFGMETLGLSRGDAGGLTLPSGFTFIAAAYPAALLAERFGRLRVIAGGMTVFAAALVLGTFLRTATGVTVALCIGAAGAACFLVNAAVVLWNLAPSAQVFGTYAGMYSISWASGGFVGPTLVGAMVDGTGWPLMLIDIALIAAVAIALVIRIDIGRWLLARTRTHDGQTSRADEKAVTE
ncbi:MFS family permease [Streptomyces sp. SAI-135]|uniref:MFS transporter n=1 Tax=unclassified Streptomyces TaxID=2593676 RepID=UPI002472EFC7|nr:MULTISPECIES: MFS transporter [unclassified Streptomyces]MDH6522917.1 MFS family permease [Streptomyces sp. SAI-090]MDH6554538.1 MFS family permease [Streptomyces sp. SAI-041]MDH6573804.1 MFS family permease [Streptomyces sp. SAI-117]MDH6581465.1 MFS family permease [Streptomyces sp. SAI-133]MDH6613469.1 MFS family permease [Streptomyces sp. SAI-135]